MDADFSRLGRIAIVNRGEPAMRAIHAVREVRAEHGASVTAVALHTEAERSAMFAREADDAQVLTPRQGSQGIPYLDLPTLEKALLDARADSVWVGWGFVAERPEFAELCEQLGLTFIGPSASVMRALGDKIGAKRLAEQAGVPVSVWSNGPVADIDEAADHAQRIGFPLVVKAAAGGGGRGIRLVHDPAELPNAFVRARDEAARSFGDSTLFMERLVTHARHIEVQVIADNHGTVWTPGVRDCTIQRRNQKVLEESSSPVLSPERSAELATSAAELVRLADYRNAGTVEFLYQPATGDLSFLEVNTRLQVEHPVTERTTGLDLVKLQLLVAADGRLEGDVRPTIGHAIEVRLNAEDAERGFAPAPGVIERLDLPAGPGIRVDTGVSEGDTIPPEYDSMIAKIIAYGRHRTEALARLRRALAQTTVLVRGGTTNRAFLQDLVDHPAVIAGEVDTKWLDRLTADDGWQFATRPDVALVAAAIEAYQAEERLDVERFFASAARGRPQLKASIPRTVDLRLSGTQYRLAVARVDRDRYDIALGDDRVAVRVEPLRPYERRLTIGAERLRITTLPQGPEQLIEVNGIPHRISQDDAGLIRAPGPSVVVAVTVSDGDQVEAGQSVVVLESMKMETVLTAPFSGVVVEIMTSGNVQLDAGAPIMRLEAVGDEVAATGPEVDLTELAERSLTNAPAAREFDALDTLRRLILGWDIASGDIPATLQLLNDTDPSNPRVMRGELDVLRMFADLASLTRNRRVGDAEDDQQQHAAREHLHAFLRSVDVDAERLPATFEEKLRRALADYGVDDLTRSPALEEALFRIYRAQQHAADHVAAILALLERRLDAGPPVDPDLAISLRDTLDRLVSATQVRHPVIGDLARRVRYRAFDQPRLVAQRDAVYDEVRQHLRALATDLPASQRDRHIEAAVGATEPLLGLLTDPVIAETGTGPLLEVLTRRYYRTRNLIDVASASIHGRACFVAEFADRRGRGRVVSVAGQSSELDDVLAAAVLLTSDVPSAHGAGAAADLYLARNGDAEPTDVLADRFSVALDAVSVPHSVRRVTLTVSGSPSGDTSRPSVDHLTFRRKPGEDRFVEVDYLRGIHPLIASRLHLWRFEHFDLDRLPSTDGVYIFDATARDVISDRRMFVLAEVRDLTPVRDVHGKVQALPEIERVLAACLDDLRRARAWQAPEGRPEWNRVILNVWPVVRLPLRDVYGVIRALAPMTEGLGLEQVIVQARMADGDNEPRPVVVRMTRPPGQGLAIKLTEPPTEPMQPFDETTQKILQARRRGTVYPFEIVPLLVRSPDGPEVARAEGSFVEHDLDGDALVPVDRPPGRNTAGLVVGTVTTPTAAHPEGMRRVVILGDPTKGLGSIAEAECRRIIAAIGLAEREQLPIEWFAVSSGARIAMDSGTENMDWVARVLRRIIEFTQARGEINVIVTGINVGAQPYWNAEATMLMHTRGILVMTPDSAMVLTGKQALDYSGGVSAEDNFGIGGYDRIMGPNGQAQYWAPDLGGACDVLFAHYAHSYIAPGERFPRRAPTTDPVDRDVRDQPHAGEGADFATVGEIFSETTNPGRKKPFDIRSVLNAVADQDHRLLERWADMADAEMAVVLDAHVGGWPVTLLGFESRPLPRRGLLPADGPEQWTAGTLFPRASNKTARAINAASGNRPVVVLANLSGFDGSPESLRQLQLEYGAEIGRAVVNFDGPIIFCVVSRYHGGAFVVFSGALHDHMEVIALEGTHASVIGGPPAAAVVFASEVNRRTNADDRVTSLVASMRSSDDATAARLRTELAEVRERVRSEMLGQVAAEFDAVHSVERARQMGSVDAIIPPEQLRPYLIDAIERGIRATLER